MEGQQPSSTSFDGVISGLPTQFWVSLYADRILVIATQLGTLGTIIQAQKESVLGGGDTYQVTTLLGRRDDPLPELCARQLAERLAECGCQQPLLLCLGLARDKPATAAATMDAGSPAPEQNGHAPAISVKELIEAVLAHPVW